MTLTLDVRPHDATTAVIALTGQLGAMNTADLKDAVTAALDAGQNHVLLDMSGVDFIDSSGLGAVIGGLKATRLAGGDLRLVSPGAQVTMILRLTNLDQILPVYTSVEAACTDDAS